MQGWVFAMLTKNDLKKVEGGASIDFVKYCFVEIQKINVKLQCSSGKEVAHTDIYRIMKNLLLEM